MAKQARTSAHFCRRWRSRRKLLPTSVGVGEAGTNVCLLLLALAAKHCRPCQSPVHAAVHAPVRMLFCHILKLLHRCWRHKDNKKPRTAAGQLSFGRSQRPNQCTAPIFPCHAPFSVSGPPHLHPPPHHTTLLAVGSPRRRQRLIQTL